MTLKGAIGKEGKNLYLIEVEGVKIVPGRVSEGTSIYNGGFVRDRLLGFSFTTRWVMDGGWNGDGQPDPNRSSPRNRDPAFDTQSLSSHRNSRVLLRKADLSLTQTSKVDEVKSTRHRF